MECEFIEKPPPEFIQSECPVCARVLREPYQATCCGYSFCRVCIERTKTDSKPCPTCAKDLVAIFHNKRLQRSLYGYKVYCSHKQEGCEWKGELGQLDNHLNLSPQPDKQLEGCEYSEIECLYCSELTRRFNITAHQNSLCSKRPFSCEHCNNYESHYEDVIQNHWPVCGCHPVRCDTMLPHIAIPANSTKSGLSSNITLPTAWYSEQTEYRLIHNIEFQSLQNKVMKLERENQMLKCQLGKLKRCEAENKKFKRKIEKMKKRKILHQRRHKRQGLQLLPKPPIYTGFSAGSSVCDQRISFHILLAKVCDSSTHWPWVVIGGTIHSRLYGNKWVEHLIHEAGVNPFVISRPRVPKQRLLLQDQRINVSDIDLDQRINVSDIDLDHQILTSKAGVNFILLMKRHFASTDDPETVIKNVATLLQSLKYSSFTKAFGTVQVIVHKDNVCLVYTPSE